MNVKDDPQVIIARVDCTQHNDLCAKYDVTGYPTIRFFKLGEEKSTKFVGSRDMSTLSEFINNQLHPEELNGFMNNENSSQPILTDKGMLVELTESNFAQHVSSGNHFVKFYAPWCSFCQRLAPIWDELAKKLKQDSVVRIAKIDCTIYRPICKDFEVKSYPTLLWIEDGKKIAKYNGERTLDDLHTYVQKMLGVVIPSSGSQNENLLLEPAKKHKFNVIQVSSHNFAQTVANSITFVKFYAPWCGHCQKLSPIWDQLAEAVHADERLSNIKIAKVDCTVQENIKLCMDQQIEGYPTLLVYKDGERQREYEDSRSLNELLSYVQQFSVHDEL